MQSTEADPSGPDRDLVSLFSTASPENKFYLSFSRRPLPRCKVVNFTRPQSSNGRVPSHVPLQHVLPSSRRGQCGEAFTRFHESTEEEAAAPSFASTQDSCVDLAAFLR